MKIVHVHTGNLPIPPNGWGAVEKIIWEYKLSLEKLGHSCDVLYLNEIQKDKYDVVHVHLANLALELHEKGIPYYFTCHDHHAFLYGKDSFCFKQNYDAILRSVKSFVPAKYLVDYFGLPNLEYVSHGLNSDSFYSEGKVVNQHKLLCVANNGFIHDQSEDRKGFSFAIEAAKALNLPITIVGPKNNKSFFDKHEFNYGKLSVLYDLTEEELIKVYRQHSIFVHASILEAGHPNLTLLEALGCGLPIVGTFEEDNDLPGLERVSRNTNQIIKAIEKIIQNYEHYLSLCKQTAKNKSWENITLKLISAYSNTMKSQLEAIYQKTKIRHAESRVASNRVDIVSKDFCKVEIVGSFQELYNVKFIDKKTNSLIHEADISNNMWCSTNPVIGVEWKVVLTERSSGKITEYDCGMPNEKINIINESGSLGDAIAWIPVVNEFAIQKDKKVNLYTPFKDLFQKEYPLINFHDYSVKPKQLSKNDYILGCFDDFDWKALNLQEIASKILGLEHKEIFPKITLPKQKEKKFKKKYVCIATQSTSQCKYWNNEEGWVKVVDYLKSIGYDVVCIDKHYMFGVQGHMNEIPYNCINDTGEKPLEDRINTILGCEFFIGLSSGLSWLAWACKKKCIMISGFTDAFHEFQSKYRIINKNVCNSCWHDSSLKFQANNWLWCPRDKNFECSREISFEMVKQKIDLCIKDLFLGS
jgi:autotransporter strand-loop-strand O-heptosyltransferase